MLIFFYLYSSTLRKVVKLTPPPLNLQRDFCRVNPLSFHQSHFSVAESRNIPAAPSSFEGVDNPKVRTELPAVELFDTPPPPTPIFKSGKSVRKIQSFEPAILFSNTSNASCIATISAEDVARELVKKDICQTLPKSQKKITWWENLGFVTKKGVRFASAKVLRLNMEDFLALDCEFSDLSKGGRVVSLGIVRMNNFRITDTYDQLINPGKPIHPKVEQLTKLKWKDLEEDLKSEGWKELIGEPKFEEVAEDILRYIRNARILVFFNKYRDLQFLNKELELAGYSYRLEDRHETVDLSELPEFSRKSLSTACAKHNIRIQAHDALSDARGTAQLFIQEVLEKKLAFPFGIDLSRFHNLSPLLPISETPGENFFRRSGVKGVLPEAISFSSNFFDFDTGLHRPSILTFFGGMQTNFKGVYVRSVDGPEKSFYGSPHETVDIFPGNPKTTLIGDIMSALRVKDVLVDHENAHQLTEVFGVCEGGFNIRAYLDIEYLASIPLDPNVKHLILLLNDTGRDRKSLKETLAKPLERFFSRQFFEFIHMPYADRCLNDYTIKFDKKDWTIFSDTRDDDKRYIKARKDGEHDLSITAYLSDNRVTVDGVDLSTLTESLLIAQPKIDVRIAFLKAGLDKAIHLTGVSNDQLIRNMLHMIPLSSLRDLSSLGMVEFSKKLIERAQFVQKNSLGATYLEGRGIEDFSGLRWMPGMFNNLLKEYFPAICEPYFNRDGVMVAAEFIFFQHDGSRLKHPAGKLTYGIAKGAFSDVTKGPIVLHGEYKAESLVEIFVESVIDGYNLFQVLNKLKKENTQLFATVCKALGISNAFRIKACGGISEFIHTPCEKKTKKVVIIADKDKPENVDAKREIREAVENFINRGCEVLLTVPIGSSEKLDINDVYLQAPSSQREEKVAEVLCQALRIYKASDLGENEEPLDKTLERVRMQAAFLHALPNKPSKRLQKLLAPIVEEQLLKRGKS
ncbi:MAG: 3'-5' exonuclease [Alphaproteobacteria bacterium]|nr:MAG: 3'-5' exonuclease [Alphaproteobacteria bacterium]